MSEVTYKSLNFFGFPAYFVGDDGSVWSMHERGRNGPDNPLQLADRPDTHDHLFVVLSHQNKRKSIAIAQLVLLAFVGDRPPKTEACHKDGNHRNNTPGNLYWGTHKQNMADRSAHGHHYKPGGGKPKLNQKTADAIRIRWGDADKKQSRFAFCKSICGEYGVHSDTVMAIINNKRWKNTPG